MFESINAVGFFENLWGFIPYWGINESAFCPMLVFETEKSISDNFIQITGVLFSKIFENNWIYRLIESVFNR